MPTADGSAFVISDGGDFTVTVDADTVPLKTLGVARTDSGLTTLDVGAKLETRYGKATFGKGAKVSVAAFQQFWRENAGANKAPFEYNEAYPHIVLQAFLQRVLNGGGEIIREMALGKGALDLGVKFRGATYPVEVKMRYLFDKSPEKAYAQVARYIDHLNQTEGWLVVFDPDLTKPWDQKVSTDELTLDGKIIHVVRY